MDENYEYQKKEKELNEKLSFAVSLIKSKKYEEAKRVLNDYLDYALPFSKESNDTRYFSFRDEIEFYAATKIVNLNKNATWTKFKLSYVYNLLMFISNEEKNYEASLDYGTKALYFNPMDSNLYFELAETYKFQKDFESMYNLTLESYKVLFDASELARYYRNLGYYFTEVKNYDMAYALYIISLSFEASETAYHEIGYIKSELKNPDYSLTMNEIKELLSNNNIEIGISKYNRNILEDYIKENNTDDKFVLVSSAKSMLKKTSVDILDPEEALSLVILPHISTKDMFDESKNILSDNDKTRALKNINYLKENDIEYISDMKGIPIDRVTTLKTEEEIIMRMLREYAIATISMYALNNKTSLIPLALDSMNTKLGLRKCLSIRDFELITSISKGLVPKDEIDNLTWMFESVYVYLWILGLVEKPDYTKECDVVKIDEILISTTNEEELYSKCKLIDKESIMEYLDLVTRLNYALTSSTLKGKKMDINSSVIKEHKESLEWALNFKIESLMNDYITIDYKKNEFNFSFKIPSSLHIKELINIKKPKNMLSLTSSLEDSVITFVKHKKNVDSDLLEELYKKDVDEYITFGWTLVKENIFNSKNIGIVYEAYLNVTLDNKTKPEFGIVKDYFILNGDLVSIESLLEKDIDYTSVDRLEKSKNRLISYNIVNSIKENTDTLLEFKLLDNFKKKDIKDDNVVLNASYNAFNEVISIEREMNEDKLVDEYIKDEVKKRIKKIKEYSKDNSAKNIFFYKEYEKYFVFKIYVEDVFIDNGDNKNILRVMSAYFSSYKEDILYKVSLSVGPFKYPTETLIIGEINENDKLTMSMLNMFYEILDSIKYKKSSK